MLLIMKQLLLTFSILISITSFSQTYLPMLEEGNVWNTVTYNYPEPKTITNRTYEITGQQIIGGITYYSVTGNCLMRDENGKVYAYNENEGIDELLFDFTLEVGDEIFLDPNNPPSCYEIGGIYYEGAPIIVSSVYNEFLAGANRKVIELEYEGILSETWIEGIGTLNGFQPYGFTHFDGGSSLSCFTTNGVTYYFNGYTECIILGIEDVEKNKITLFPNPVTKTSVINFPNEFEIDALIILDLSGRIINKEQISGSFIYIDGSQFIPGIYFYQVFSKGKLIKTEKFLVEYKF